MQNSFPYIDILIFGVIAIFLIFRLKNILGQNSENNNQNQKIRSEEKNFGNVVKIDTKGLNKKSNVKIEKI